MTDKTPPKTIDGAPVSVIDGREPLIVGGCRWVTLMPADENDQRVWEFCLDTGRLILTIEA